MNIANIIIQLQTILNEIDDPETLMIVSKTIEKLNISEITVIERSAQLPSLPLSENGHIYLDESSEDLYYNTGTKWYRFPVTFGDVYCAWGFNVGGQLGDGTTVDKSSPVSGIGGIANWSQVSAGRRHSLGVTSSGIAWAWGSNGNGRLGDGTPDDKSSPVSVIGGITDWSQVSAGTFHSLGVTSSGIAWAWGFNDQGRLGDGTTVTKSSPVSVIGGITNWSQVDAGGIHSLGVTSSGIAWAWGYNVFGQLGDGTTVTKSSPVSVIGGITDWSQVSAGTFHNLGVTSSGIAWAWGFNGEGRLGDGTTANKSSPVSVIGGITNWSQVSAGSYHSLGVTSSGIAWAWGSNGNGRLGDGTTFSKASPVSVIGGITNWSQVSAGSFHSLGVTSSGIAWAWGSNGYGQLGDGTTVSKSSPVSVIGGITNWSQVSAGSYHSLAIANQKI